MSSIVDVLQPYLQSCILYIYAMNIGTEYFKHGYTLHFFLFKMQFVSLF